MKHAHCIAFLISCATATLADAQTNSYYNSRQYQNNQYKTLGEATQRAYSIPSRPYNASSNAGNKSSGSTYNTPSGNSSKSTQPIGSGNIGYSDIGAYDKVKRQEAAGRQLEEMRRSRAAALDAAEKQYAALIADHGNAKTEEDHYDLLLRGMRAGIDLNAVFKVIGKNINEYKSRVGNKPDVPYKSSAAIAYESYLNSYTKELTKMLTETGDPHSKMIFLKEIVKINPSFDNYLALGENAFLNKQYEDARDAFRQAHQKNANHFIALAGYGDALVMLGNAVDAEQEYRKALAIDSANADVLLKTAWTSFIQNNPGDAYDLVKSATLLIPDEAGPYLFLATLQPEGNDRDLLLSHASAVQNSIRPGSLGDMLLNYAKYLQSKNAFEISLIFLDLAVAADAKNFDYLEMRYGTNKLLKRGKQAAIDAQLMEKL